MPRQDIVLDEIATTMGAASSLSAGAKLKRPVAYGLPLRRPVRHRPPLG